MQGKSVLSPAFLASLYRRSRQQAINSQAVTRGVPSRGPFSPGAASTFSRVVRHVFRDICGLDKYGERASPPQAAMTHHIAYQQSHQPPCWQERGSTDAGFSHLRRRDNFAPVHQAARSPKRALHPPTSPGSSPRTSPERRAESESNQRNNQLEKQVTARSPELGEAGATPPFAARCVTVPWGRSRLTNSKNAGGVDELPELDLIFSNCCLRAWRHTRLGPCDWPICFIFILACEPRAPQRLSITSGHGKHGLGWNESHSLTPKRCVAVASDQLLLIDCR